MASAPTAIDIEVGLGLAVTARCCGEDLRADPEASLDELVESHPVVDKFVTVRGAHEDGQETIRSIHGPLPVFSLHAGRMRGATCSDRGHQVVWLLAAGIHRGGDRKDAYRVIEQLHAGGRLFPSEDDYRRLFRRRNAAAVPLIVSRMRAVTFAARDDPGRAQSVLLPGGVVASVLIEPRAEQGELPAVEEMWLSVTTEGLQPGWLPVIQGAVSIGDDPRQFEYTQDYPGRGPDRLELRFRYWQEVAE